MKVDDEADFILCDCVWKKILNKLGERPAFEDFPEKERIVIVSSATQGIVGNGGFEYLLSLDLLDDPFLTHTIHAFKSLKLNKAVMVIKTLLTFFPNSQLPIDEDERMEIFYKIEEEIRDDLDSKFYAATSNFTQELVAYIRKNQDIFSKYHEFYLH